MITLIISRRRPHRIQFQASHAALVTCCLSSSCESASASMAGSCPTLSPALHLFLPSLPNAASRGVGVGVLLCSLPPYSAFSQFSSSGSSRSCLLDLVALEAAPSLSHLAHPGCFPVCPGASSQPYLLSLASSPWILSFNAPKWDTTSHT